MTNLVIDKITAQQAGHENTAPWMVGEQLKDICRADNHAAEIVCADLENPEMSIYKCETKIREYADKHRSGNCAVVPPNVAENIIREFYGLPAAAETKPDDGIIDLSDFLL